MIMELTHIETKAVKAAIDRECNRIEGSIEFAGKVLDGDNAAEIKAITQTKIVNYKRQLKVLESAHEKLYESKP